MASVVPYDPQDTLEANPFAEHSSVVTDTPTIQDQEDDATDNELTKEEEPIPSSNPVESNTTDRGSALNTQPPANKKSTYDDLNILPERKNIKKYNLIVKVTGIERVGSTSNKRENPTVVFDCSTNIPTFRKKNHKKIRKTTQEFTQLSKYLNSSIPESFIPSLPSPFTNYGINNEEDHNKTVRCYQEWFNRISADPLIVRNEEVAFFIESDFNTYTPVNKAKAQVSGLRRKTLKQLSPPYDEVVELAEFRPLVKSIYLRSQNIQDRLSKAGKTKRLLVQEENDFGQKFGRMDINENENKLYKRYGRVMTAVGDINSVIATMDMATLFDGLEWIIRDTYIVKEALTNRHFVMRELIQAQQSSKSKQEQARKLRSRRDTNPIKVDEALQNLKFATQNEQELTLKLQRITCNMLIERKQWISWYETWLISSIKEYTLRRIEYERKKLTLLERIRLEVRRADTKGGLSRLGRDTVSLRDNEVSQSVHGDSWAGDVRRRSQQQIDRVTHTEFDKSITVDSADDTISDACKDLSKSDESSMLDARNAAHLLGISSFQVR